MNACGALCVTVYIVYCKVGSLPGTRAPGAETYGFPTRRSASLEQGPKPDIHDQCSTEGPSVSASCAKKLVSIRMVRAAPRPAPVAGSGCCNPQQPTP